MKLKAEVERLHFSLDDVRHTVSSEAELRLKYERELEDYTRLIALLKELINSGNTNRDGHLSALGQ